MWGGREGGDGGKEGRKNEGGEQRGRARKEGEEERGRAKRRERRKEGRRERRGKEVGGEKRERGREEEEEEMPLDRGRDSCVIIFLENAVFLCHL
jgi:hypothetical protein